MFDPFRSYQWLFVVIMPFGPIMLDLQGFYQSPLKRVFGLQVRNFRDGVRLDLDRPLVARARSQDSTAH